MNAIIIEDEKPAARRLQRMLNKNGIEINTMLHSVQSSIEWLLNNPKPDLIFLDIQLSDGLSFEIFEEVTIDSSIIFTTAYDEYALKAFKLNSIDYLLKPIDEDELKNALTQYDKQHKNTVLNLAQIQSLFKINNPYKKYKKRFSIKVGQHLKIINTSDIICFYSEDKTTYIKTKENRDYIVEKSLDDLERELSPQTFFKINRKIIININSIDDIISYSNSRLKLKIPFFNNFEAIVSREKVKDFKKWLES